MSARRKGGGSPDAVPSVGTPIHTSTSGCVSPLNGSQQHQSAAGGGGPPLSPNSFIIPMAPIKEDTVPSRILDDALAETMAPSAMEEHHGIIGDGNRGGSGSGSGGVGSPSGGGSSRLSPTLGRPLSGILKDSARTPQNQLTPEAAGAGAGGHGGKSPVSPLSPTALATKQSFTKPTVAIPTSTAISPRGATTTTTLGGSAVVADSAEFSPLSVVSPSAGAGGVLQSPHSGGDASASNSPQTAALCGATSNMPSYMTHTTASLASAAVSAAKLASIHTPERLLPPTSATTLAANDDDKKGNQQITTAGLLDRAMEKGLLKIDDHHLEDDSWDNDGAGDAASLVGSLAGAGGGGVSGVLVNDMSSGTLQRSQQHTTPTRQRLNKPFNEMTPKEKAQQRIDTVIKTTDVDRTVTEYGASPARRYDGKDDPKPRLRPSSAAAVLTKNTTEYVDKLVEKVISTSTLAHVDRAPLAIVTDFHSSLKSKDIIDSRMKMGGSRKVDERDQLLMSFGVARPGSAPSGKPPLFFSVDASSSTNHEEGASSFPLTKAANARPGSAGGGLMMSQSSVLNESSDGVGDGELLSESQSDVLPQSNSSQLAKRSKRKQSSNTKTQQRSKSVTAIPRGRKKELSPAFLEQSHELATEAVSQYAKQQQQKRKASTSSSIPTTNSRLGSAGRVQVPPPKTPIPLSPMQLRVHSASRSRDPHRYHKESQKTTKKVDEEGGGGGRAQEEEEAMHDKSKKGDKNKKTLPHLRPGSAAEERQKTLQRELSQSRNVQNPKAPVALVLMQNRHDVMEAFSRAGKIFSETAGEYDKNDGFGAPTGGGADETKSVDTKSPDEVSTAATSPAPTTIEGKVLFHTKSGQDIGTAQEEEVHGGDKEETSPLQKDNDGVEKSTARDEKTAGNISVPSAGPQTTNSGESPPLLTAEDKQQSKSLLSSPSSFAVKEDVRRSVDDEEMMIAEDGDNENNSRGGGPFAGIQNYDLESDVSCLASKDGGRKSLVEGSQDGGTQQVAGLPPALTTTPTAATEGTPGSSLLQQQRTPSQDAVDASKSAQDQRRRSTKHHQPPPKQIDLNKTLPATSEYFHDIRNPALLTAIAVSPTRNAQLETQLKSFEADVEETVLSRIPPSPFFPSFASKWENSRKVYGAFAEALGGKHRTLPTTAAAQGTTTNNNNVGAADDNADDEAILPVGELRPQSVMSNTSVSINLLDRLNRSSTNPNQQSDDAAISDGQDSLSSPFMQPNEIVKSESLHLLGSSGEHDDEVVEHVKKRSTDGACDAAAGSATAALMQKHRRNSQQREAATGGVAAADGLDQTVAGLLNTFVTGAATAAGGKRGARTGIDGTQLTLQQRSALRKKFEQVTSMRNPSYVVELILNPECPPFDNIPNRPADQPVTATEEHLEFVREELNKNLLLPTGGGVTAEVVISKEVYCVCLYCESDLIGLKTLHDLLNKVSGRDIPIFSNAVIIKSLNRDKMLNESPRKYQDDELAEFAAEAKARKLAKNKKGAKNVKMRHDADGGLSLFGLEDDDFDEDGDGALYHSDSSDISSQSLTPRKKKQQRKGGGGAAAGKKGGKKGKKTKKPKTDGELAAQAARRQKRREADNVAAAVSADELQKSLLDNGNFKRSSAAKNASTTKPPPGAALARFRNIVQKKIMLGLAFANAHDKAGNSQQSSFATWRASRKDLKRNALIIANSTFPDSNIPPCPAVHQDSEQYREMFTKFGYEVDMIREDAEDDFLTPTIKNINRTIRTLMNNVASAESSIVIVILSRGMIGSAGTAGMHAKSRIAFTQEAKLAGFEAKHVITPEGMAQFEDRFGNRPLVVIDTWPVPCIPAPDNASSMSPAASNAAASNPVSVSYASITSRIGAGSDMSCVYPKNAGGLLSYYFLRALHGFCIQGQIDIKTAAITMNMLSQYLAPRLERRRCAVNTNTHATGGISLFPYFKFSNFSDGDVLAASMASRLKNIEHASMTEHVPMPPFTPDVCTRIKAWERTNMVRVNVTLQVRLGAEAKPVRYSDNHGEFQIQLVKALAKIFTSTEPPAATNVSPQATSSTGSTTPTASHLSPSSVTPRKQQHLKHMRSAHGYHGGRGGGASAAHLFQHVGSPMSGSGSTHSPTVNEHLKQEEERELQAALAQKNGKPPEISFWKGDESRLTLELRDPVDLISDHSKAETLFAEVQRLLGNAKQHFESEKSAAVSGVFHFPIDFGYTPVLGHGRVDIDLCGPQQLHWIENTIFERGKGKRVIRRPRNIYQNVECSFICTRRQARKFDRLVRQQSIYALAVVNCVEVDPHPPAMHMLMSKVQAMVRGAQQFRRYTARKKVSRAEEDERDYIVDLRNKGIGTLFFQFQSDSRWALEEVELSERKDVRREQCSLFVNILQAAVTEIGRVEKFHRKHLYLHEVSELHPIHEEFARFSIIVEERNLFKGLRHLQRLQFHEHWNRFYMELDLYRDILNIRNDFRTSTDVYFRTDVPRPIPPSTSYDVALDIPEELGGIGKKSQLKMMKELRDKAKKAATVAKLMPAPQRVNVTNMFFEGGRLEAIEERKQQRRTGPNPFAKPAAADPSTTNAAGQQQGRSPINVTFTPVEILPTAQLRSQQRNSSLSVSITSSISVDSDEDESSGGALPEEEMEDYQTVLLQQRLKRALEQQEDGELDSITSPALQGGAVGDSQAAANTTYTSAFGGISYTPGTSAGMTLHGVKHQQQRKQEELSQHQQRQQRLLALSSGGGGGLTPRGPRTRSRSPINLDLSTEKPKRKLSPSSRF